ncbi:MAG: PilN domain-containing protein [Burkholderiales bacterium]|nr:PilN domain-containing protein [Burkholderiales bacterium]MDQ3197403.1 PilN domain-containing protein [Pseudomonadota bacterium]
MIRINLLPHREMKRAARQREFYIFAGAAAFLGVAIWFAVHGVNSSRIENQMSRNSYLETEIATLDKQIEEIRKIKELTQALLGRKAVVETLQGNRAETVHVLDQMARQLPDGVYLKGIKQAGNSLSLSGYAQSNARVSTLMRNLDSSPWLELPALVEIKAAQQGPTRLSEFSLNLKTTRETLTAESTAPKLAAQRTKDKSL